MRAHYDSVELRFNCTDEMYGPDIRKYQGVPTLAITKGGRIFLGWCSGGNAEPRIENFDILHYSDDLGKTFKKIPVVVIDSDREKLIHAFDLQLWVDPNGALHVVWVQEDARPKRPDENPKWTPENPIATGEGGSWWGRGRLSSSRSSGLSSFSRFTSSGSGSSSSSKSHCHDRLRHKSLITHSRQHFEHLFNPKDGNA